MNANRRTLLKAMGGSAAIAALAGCSDDDGVSGPTMWTDLADAEDEDMQAAIAAYEEETGLELTQEEPGGDLDQQIETAIPAGDGPHSWIWAHDWVGRFAVREEPEFLYDASDDIDVDLDAYTGAARDAVQFDGAVHGLPFASETVTLYYNEDMVDEPPETLDEMVDIMEDFHDPANGEYGLSYPATDPYFASGFLQAYGGDLYDEDALEVTVDSDECKQGLEALETLFDYIPEDPGYESQIIVFADELAPFAINGPWELGNLNEEVENVGVAELPTVDGNHPRTYSGIQMFYFSSMLADAEDDTLDAITGFAEWYTTNEETVLDNADNHGFIPVLEAAVTDADLSDEVEAFAQQVDHGVPMPTHPDMDSVWEPVEEALTRVFNEDQAGDEALDQAASEIRERL
ncbi:substrate-binding domain-containing protein [Halorubrum tibetense]|uniref:Substrate-binding domain-containing protein n=1 Tax=Halorubrum tibetense TaxID=175631 RepID=A0ABD5S9V6_9EURY